MSSAFSMRLAPVTTEECSSSNTTTCKTRPGGRGGAGQPRWNEHHHHHCQQKRTNTPTDLSSLRRRSVFSMTLQRHAWPTPLLLCLRRSGEPSGALIQRGRHQQPPLLRLRPVLARVPHPAGRAKTPAATAPCPSAAGFSNRGASLRTLCARCRSFLSQRSSLAQHSTTHNVHLNLRVRHVQTSTCTYRRGATRSECAASATSCWFPSCCSGGEHKPDINSKSE